MDKIKKSIAQGENVVHMVLRKEEPRGALKPVRMLKAQLEKRFSRYEFLGNISGRGNLLSCSL